VASPSASNGQSVTKEEGSLLWKMRRPPAADDVTQGSEFALLT
jgi:hypothetical protein